MIDWMIAHNMGIIIMAVPFIMLAWAWVTITEKIFRK